MKLSPKELLLNSWKMLFSLLNKAEYHFSDIDINGEDKIFLYYNDQPYIVYKQSLTEQYQEFQNHMFALIEDGSEENIYKILTIEKIKNELLQVSEEFNERIKQGNSQGLLYDLKIAIITYSKTCSTTYSSDLYTAWKETILEVVNFHLEHIQKLTASLEKSKELVISLPPTFHSEANTTSSKKLNFAIQKNQLAMLFLGLRECGIIASKVTNYELAQFLEKNTLFKYDEVKDMQQLFTKIIQQSAATKTAFGELKEMIKSMELPTKQNI